MRVCEGVGLLGLLAQFYLVGVSWAGPVCILGRLILKYLGLSVVRVFRVPWLETQITRNNFEYRGLKPEIVFGFFGLGFFGFGFGFRVICPALGAASDDVGRGGPPFFYFYIFKNIFYRNIFLVSQFTILYSYRPAGGRQGAYRPSGGRPPAGQ